MSNLWLVWVMVDKCFPLHVDVTRLAAHTSVLAIQGYGRGFGQMSSQIDGAATMGSTVFGYAYDPHFSYEDHQRLRESMYSAATEAASLVASRLDEINATVDWGFSCILTHLHGMQLGLDQLIQIARSPAHTHALEHFAQARINWENGHYPECLAQLKQAISGDGFSPGWKEDYRFYQLAGTLYFECGDDSFIDLPKAVACFLKAARYAQADYPYEAAGALVAAGVASYSQGKMKEALGYCQAAYSLSPELGEAYFQAAKVLIFLKDCESAFPLIRRALQCDIDYARKLEEDGEFRRNTKSISGFWRSVGREAHQHVQSLSRDVDASILRVHQWQAASVHTTRFKYASYQMQGRPCFASDKIACKSAYDALCESMATIHTHQAHSVVMAKQHTVYGYLCAEKELSTAASVAAAAESKIENIISMFGRVERSAKSRRAASIRVMACGSLIGLGVGLLPVLLLYSGAPAKYAAAVLFSMCTFSWLLFTTAVGFLFGFGGSRSVWDS